MGEGGREKEREIERERESQTNLSVSIVLLSPELHQSWDVVGYSSSWLLMDHGLRESMRPRVSDSGLVGSVLSTLPAWYGSAFACVGVWRGEGESVCVHVHC